MNTNISDEVSLNSLYPVFVVGAPKSGTTFLLSLFDSHPQCITLLETGVYSFQQEIPIESDQFIQKVEEHFYPRFQSARISKGFKLDDLLKEVRKRNLMDDTSSIQKSILFAFLKGILGNLNPNRARQITHFIEKTPTNFRFVKNIYSDFPNAKIIHIVRDPRDNYLSLKRRMQDKSSSRYQNPNYYPTLFIKRRLISSLVAAFDNLAMYGVREDQYRILFYEDLIYGREKVVRQLALWLGLSWHDALLIPSLGGELWRGDSTVTDLKNRLKPFDPRPIGKWKAELSNRELKLMEYLIQCFDLQAKYQLTHPRTLMDLLVSLAMPFQDEINLEVKRLSKEKASKLMLINLGWEYIKNRRDIVHELLKQSAKYRGSDVLAANNFEP